MPRIDFAALANLLSENDPCGPGLDSRGDIDFLNFLTARLSTYGNRRIADAREKPLASVLLLRGHDRLPC